MLEIALKDYVELNGKKTRKMRVVAERLVHEAMEGNMAAIKEIFDRMEGKAAQQIFSHHVIEAADGAKAITEALGVMEDATAPKMNGHANGHDSDTPLDQS